MKEKKIGREKKDTDNPSAKTNWKIVLRSSGLEILEAKDLTLG